MQTAPIDAVAPKAHMVRVSPCATEESLASTFALSTSLPGPLRFARSGGIVALLLRTDLSAFYVAELTVRQMLGAAEQFREAAGDDGLDVTGGGPVHLMDPADLSEVELTEHPYGIQLARVGLTVYVILPRGEGTFLVSSCDVRTFLAVAAALATPA